MRVTYHLNAGFSFIHWGHLTSGQRWQASRSPFHTKIILGTKPMNQGVDLLNYRFSCTSYTVDYKGLSACLRICFLYEQLLLRRGQGFLFTLASIPWSTQLQPNKECPEVLSLSHTQGWEVVLPSPVTTSAFFFLSYPAHDLQIRLTLRWNVYLPVSSKQ